MKGRCSLSSEHAQACDGPDHDVGPRYAPQPSTFGSYPNTPCVALACKSTPCTPSSHRCSSAELEEHDQAWPGAPQACAPPPPCSRRYSWWRGQLAHAHMWCSPDSCVSRTRVGPNHHRCLDRGIQRRPALRRSRGATSYAFAAAHQPDFSTSEWS